MRDEAQSELWVLGDRYQILHLAEEYAVIEVFSTAGHGPPPHRHHRESESMYVLEGELDVQIEGSHRLIQAGECLHLPSGQVHGYRTRSATSRHLTVIVPGRFANLFLKIGHTLQEDVDMHRDAARLLALAAQFGLEIVAPDAQRATEP